MTYNANILRQPWVLLFLLPFALGALSQNSTTSGPAFSEGLYEGYPIIPYESIDTSNMRQAKKATAKNGEYRLVFYDQESDSYLKIWSEDFSHRFNFLSALRCNYYAGLTVLSGVIFDRHGNCRGYITKAQHHQLPLFYCTNRYGYTRLACVDRQPKAYQNLYNTLLKRSITHDLYYLDMVPSNLVMDEESYYLIDLEGVYTSQELLKIRETSLPEWMHTLEYLPIEYAFFIQLSANKRQ